MKKQTSLIIFLLISSVMLATVGISLPAQASGSSSYPIVGSKCKTSGEVVSSQYYKFVCTKAGGETVWKVQQLSYKTPTDYTKGYSVGQTLKRLNPNSGDAACQYTARNKNIQKDMVQAGKPASSTVVLLNTYFGYWGCIDGMNSNSKVPTKISLNEPVFSAKNDLNNTKLRDGSSVNVFVYVKQFVDTVVDNCANSAEVSLTQNCINAIELFQYPGAFDSETLGSCNNARLDSNWVITDIQWDPQSASFDPAYSHVTPVDPANNYYAERRPTDLYLETPFYAILRVSYRDDVNGDFVENRAKAFVFKDGELFNFWSTCPTFDEEVASRYTLDLPIAPVAFKAPSGKVDKTSNAYKVMFNVGANFAKISMNSDTASSQCSSAAQTGMVKNKGVPQYLGVQARQLQSYLKTASGYRGCLDGFKSG
jgi:hypothetical protein